MTLTINELAQHVFRRLAELSDDVANLLDDYSRLEDLSRDNDNIMPKLYDIMEEFNEIDDSLTRMTVAVRQLQSELSSFFSEDRT